MEKELYLFNKPDKDSKFSKKLGIFLHNLGVRIFREYIYHPNSLKEFYEICDEFKKDGRYAVLDNVSFLEVGNYEVNVILSESSRFLGSPHLEREEQHEKTVTLFDSSQDLEFRVSRSWDNCWFSMTEKRWQQLEQLKPLESIIAICTYIENTPYLMSFRKPEEWNKGKSLIPDTPKELIRKYR